MESTTFSSGRIEVAGQFLEFARWGKGNGLPVLLLHEALGSVSTWRDFPAKLAISCGREVIAWSRAGHGRSSSFPQARGADYLHREADLLPALHQALDLRSAHLLGHSDGASIALIAAARFPDLVASLVVEAPHVYVENLTRTRITQLASTFARSRMRERLKRHHLDSDTLFVDWSRIWLSSGFREWEIESVLCDITSPVLLIQGCDDEYGTLAQLDRIAIRVPEASRLEIPDCGHSPHLECQDAVLAAVRAFLRDRD